MLKGWAAGPRLRCWERLPHDLGPFSPGSLLEDEAGGDTSESSVKSLGMLKWQSPVVERGPGTSFSSSEVAFSGAPKDPLFLKIKSSSLAESPEDLDETQILLSLGWGPKILCSNELPGHPAAAGPQLTLREVTLKEHITQKPVLFTLEWPSFDW